MRISTFFYSIRQGFRNIFRNKSFSLASIATMTACLFMLGVVVCITLNAQEAVKTAEQGVSVTVYFNEGTTDERISAIGDDIQRRVEVSHTEFVSADKAWESFKTEYLGEYADGFTENPLANSMHYEIYLSDVSMQSSLVTYLQSIPEVRKVNQSKVVADFFSGFDSLVGYISLGMIVILLLVTVFLISNTVTVGISVRKEEINIMKYIGATDFFVRAPYVVEGIIIGAVGAAIPLVALYYLYINVTEFLTAKFAVIFNFMTFLPVDQIMRQLIPISFAIGVGIGFLGSFVTVRKHLRV